MTQATYDFTAIGDASPASPISGFFGANDCGNDFESSSNGLRIKYPYTAARANNIAAWFFTQNSTSDFIKVSLTYSVGDLDATANRPCLVIRNKSLSNANLFTVDIPYNYSASNKQLAPCRFYKSTFFASSGKEEITTTTGGFGTVYGTTMAAYRAANPVNLTVDVYIDKTGKGISMFVGNECLGLFYQPTWDLNNVDIGFGIYNFSTAATNANMYFKSVTFNDEITETPDYYSLPKNLARLDTTSTPVPTQTLNAVGKYPIRRATYAGVPVTLVRSTNLSYTLTGADWKTLIGLASYPKRFNLGEIDWPGEGLRYYNDLGEFVTAQFQGRTAGGGIGQTNAWQAAQLSSIGALSNSLGTYYKKNGVPATLNVGSIVVYPSGTNANGFNINLTNQSATFTGTGVHYVWVFDRDDGILRRFGYRFVDSVITDIFEANHDLNLFHRKVNCERNALIESDVFTMDANHQLANQNTSFWIDDVEISYNDGNGWTDWTVHTSGNPVDLEIGWSYKARMKSPVGYSKVREGVLHISNDPTNTTGRYGWFVSTADSGVGDPVFTPDTSKTTSEIIFDLVQNENPGEGAGLINSSYLTIGSATSVSNKVGNTQVALNAIPNSGVSGSVTVTYDRLVISRLNDSDLNGFLDIVLPIDHTASDMVAAINTELGINLDASEVNFDNVYSDFEENPYTTNMDMYSDNPVWTGTLQVRVTRYTEALSSYIVNTDLEGLELPA